MSLNSSMSCSVRKRRDALPLVRGLEEPIVGKRAKGGPLFEEGKSQCLCPLLRAQFELND